MEIKYRPFGTKFETSPEQANSQITPTYDETLGLSVISVDGKTLPFVTYGPMLGTETSTAVKGEGTDENPENTDPMLGTATATKNSTEQSDDDPPTYEYDSRNPKIVLGTSTITASSEEKTDSDD